MSNIGLLGHQEGGHVGHQELQDGVLPQRHPKELDY